MKYSLLALLLAIGIGVFGQDSTAAVCKKTEMKKDLENGLYLMADYMQMLGDIINMPKEANPKLEGFVTVPKMEYAISYGRPYDSLYVVNPVDYNIKPTVSVSKGINEKDGDVILKIYADKRVVILLPMDQWEVNH